MLSITNEGENMKALESYSVYSQIDIDVNNIFTVKLIDLGGDVKFEDIGVGRTRDEARSKAKALVVQEIEPYGIGE